MKITIVGAGMAGLIAANMLRRHSVTVIEKAKTLPYNHSALLRFRSTAVSDATAIPFTRMTMRKGLWDGNKVVNQPTIAHLNRYSRMVTDGELHDRSIMNLESGVRWVAPQDFIEQMARNVRIVFDVDVNLKELEGITISTIPMPIAMKIFDWPLPEFRYKPVWTIKAKIIIPRSKICQTLYNTTPLEWYRATIHNDELTLEFMFDPQDNILPSYRWAERAVSHFFNEEDLLGVALQDVKRSKIEIGKIMPIDDSIRKEFMASLTDRFKIYSLGRFATWRNILLDDVVNDVKRIEQMMEHGNRYDTKLSTITHE